MVNTLLHSKASKPDVLKDHAIRMQRIKRALIVAAQGIEAQHPHACFFDDDDALKRAELVQQHLRLHLWRRFWLARRHHRNSAQGANSFFKASRSARSRLGELALMTPSKSPAALLLLLLLLLSQAPAQIPCR